MTFTNRIGRDMLIKLSSEDEPKVLHASDSRVSFVNRQSGGLDKLQVGELLLVASVSVMQVYHVFIFLMKTLVTWLGI